MKGHSILTGLTSKLPDQGAYYKRMKIIGTPAGLRVSPTGISGQVHLHFAMKTCTFVTGNPNKVIEVNAILGNLIPVQPLSLDIPEIQGTLEEIARDKCRRATKIVDGPVIVEDSALEFNGMNKLPGPYVKYFLEALGNDGLNKLLSSYEDKSAEAVCTLAFSVGPTMEPLIFQGRLRGRIVPARGPPVFGWEPIFEHEGETLAEMAHEKKNSLSHRYQALLRFQEWLAQDDNRLKYLGDDR